MIDNRESSREYVDTTVRLLPQDTFKVTNDVPVRAADCIAVKNWVVTETQMTGPSNSATGRREKTVLHTSISMTHYMMLIKINPKDNMFASASYHKT